MVIYFIARGIPDAHSPQWGCFEIDQARALSAMGHKVVYLSVDSRFRLYYRRLGQTRRIVDGVICYNSFLYPNAMIIGKYFRRLARRQQWERLYKRAVRAEGKPDVLYSHYLWNTNEAVELHKKYGVPLIGIEHWSELNKHPLPQKVKRLADATYPYIDKLITVSGALQKRIEELYHIKTAVVHNMVGEEFAYQPQARSEKVQFVSTGSLVPVKCHDLMIEAFAKFGKEKSDWELNIIGDGVSRKSLQRQISRLGLTEHIHLLGKMHKSKIVNILNSSDVFVLSSRAETFSVASIEALACGLPVIATRCGGPEEFMNDNNGLLVPINDADALAKGIEYMYEHYRDYDRQAIADDCKARFSAEVIAKQLTEIFEDVTASKIRKEQE